VSFILYRVAGKGVCCSALRREGGVLLAPSSDKRERVNEERGVADFFSSFY
jgi:hypothetical protein